MPVGQPVIIALVLGQAVAVHLGQEAEMIGQREVPDLERHRQPQRSCACAPLPQGQGQRAGVIPGRQVVRDIDLDVQALVLGVGRRGG